MNIGLILLCVIWFTDLLLGAYLHGKPRENYNFWYLMFSHTVIILLTFWAVGWTFM